MDIYALFSRGKHLVHASVGETSLKPDDHPHKDLLRLIAIANALKVEIFPLTWQPSLENLGQGATGSISQSLLNDQIHFAYKRFNLINTHPDCSDKEFRKLQYDAMIAEMVVLSCGLLYRHPNIANLEGLCWEVSPLGEVWPVLVFKKATYGDLRHFLKHPEAKPFTFDDKMDICGEIAKGLRIMHRCGIIHGDIKPENILVTKAKDSESFGVYITDFGYSGFESLVRVSRSIPWEAPEWHSRSFKRENAMRMDLYSFGILCLWLLFPQSHLRSSELSDIKIDLAFEFSASEENTAMMRRLQELKRSDQLLHSVLELLARTEDIPQKTRSVLEQVFKMSLHKDPLQRATHMDRFVDLLCNSENITSIDLEDTIESATMPPWHGTFNINNILFQVDNCDFKVQKKIVDELVATAEDVKCLSCSKNAAFQLALCYSCGFGCRADFQTRRSWLEKSQKSGQELSNHLDALKNMTPRTDPLRQLIAQGFQTDLISSYAERKMVDEAIMEYRAMTADRAKAFGDTHFATRMTARLLASLLKRRGRKDAALELTIEDMEYVEQELHPEAEEVLFLRYNLADTYLDVGEYQKARSQAQAILDSGLSTENLLYPQTLSLLSMISIKEGNYEDALEGGIAAADQAEILFGAKHLRTLIAKSAVATTYSKLGNVVKAIEINEQVALIREEQLGRDHDDTLESLERIGIQYNQLGKNEKASNLFKRIWETRSRRFEKTSRDTLRAGMNYAAVLPSLGRENEAVSILEELISYVSSGLDPEFQDLGMSMKANLAVAYEFQRNHEKSEPLQRDVLSYNREKYGNSNKKTLQSMHDLSDTLFNLGKWKETFDISLEEIEIRKSLWSEVNRAKILAIESATLSAVRLEAWDKAAPLFEQELAWRQEMMKSEGEGDELGHSLLRTLCLAATTYLHVGKIENAKLHIASFLKLITKAGSVRTSITDTIEDLAVLCERKGAIEEAEQLTILEILMMKSWPSNNKSSLEDLVKRVLDLKERQGTTGSGMVFSPTHLIKQARELPTSPASSTVAET